MWSSSPSPTWSSSKGSYYGNNYSPSPDFDSWEQRASYYPSRTPSPQQSPWANPLKVGDRVIVRSSVGDAKTGILQYVGEVEFANGGCGTELAEVNVCNLIRLPKCPIHFYFRALGRCGTILSTRQKRWDSTRS